MNEKIIQEKTVSAILQEPVRFWATIESPNILHKIGILKKKKAYWIKPPSLATVIRISREILKLTDIRGVSDTNIAAKIIEQAESNIDGLTNIICLAIHNRKELPEKKLKNFLIKNLTINQMLQIFVIIVSMLDVQSFTNTITLITGVSLLKTEELIAFGEQSGESKNISGSG